MINSERLALALEQLRSSDGTEFERFANAFLAPDLPGLRPVAGMHDGGRDAFIHSDSEMPDCFVQHSVTPDWQKKIQNTIKDLRKNGHQVRELIYCSPLDVQRHADDLKRQLRKDRVSLDIRDRAYFLANANRSPGTETAAEQLARRYVDPLISRKAIAEASRTAALTFDEERVAATFLACAVRDRNPEKGLTKFTYDSLVTYVLRDATPEALVPRSDVLAFVQRLTPSTEAARCKELVEQSLTRLVGRSVAKHHTKEDAFTLAAEVRREMRERLASFVAEAATVEREVCERVQIVATSIGIDFQFVPSDVGRDCVIILDQVLASQSRHAAHALVKEQAFFFKREDATEVAQRVLATKDHQLRSVPKLTQEQFLDLVPAILDDLVANPPDSVLHKFNNAGAAYCMLFALREAPDLQMALQKVFRTAQLLVDTSALVPCLAEVLLPKKEQRMSNLLRIASETGIRLVTTADVLNELETHLERVRYAYSKRVSGLVAKMGAQAVAFGSGSLIASYLTHGAAAGIGSIDEFINLFMGRENPKLDLIEFLKEQFGVSYEEMDAELADLSPQEVGEVTETWKGVRKKKAEMDDDVFDRLIHHDVRSLLLTRSLRADSVEEATYGHTWWWLTRDRSAFRVDNKIRLGKGASFCMSPEFFVRYLSMRPATAKSSNTTLLPVSVEMAGLGLVPHEVRDEAIRLFENSKGWPEYLRRRQLRDLVNKAYSEREEHGVDKMDVLGA